jgi:hypothetical protein
VKNKAPCNINVPNKLLPTKVFAIAGLDGRTIGSKSLISLSTGLTLIIKQQMLSSAIKH